jgi:tight adherence protein B
MNYWMISILNGLSAAGLIFAIAQALQAGAEDYTRHYTERAARHLEDMFLFIPPKRILDLAMAMAAFVFVIAFTLTGSFASATGFFRGLGLGVAAGAGAWTVPRHVLAYLKKRRLQRFNNQLSDGLMTMSNALKAGFSILQAFETVVRNGLNPIAQEFGLFLHETRIGVRFEEALNNMKDRMGSEDLTLMIVAIETARLTGGNLTEVLENIAHTIRERGRIERRVRTLTAMGRLQGAIVAVMPLVLALAMTALDPRMMMGFFHSTAGLATILLVALLEVSGILLIRKIVRIDV